MDVMTKQWRFVVLRIEARKMCCVARSSAAHDVGHFAITCTSLDEGVSWPVDNGNRDDKRCQVLRRSTKDGGPAKSVDPWGHKIVGYKFCDLFVDSYTSGHEDDVCILGIVNIKISRELKLAIQNMTITGASDQSSALQFEARSLADDVYRPVNNESRAYEGIELGLIISSVPCSQGANRLPRTRSEVKAAANKRLLRLRSQIKAGSTSRSEVKAAANKRLLRARSQIKAVKQTEPYVETPVETSESTELPEYFYDLLMMKLAKINSWQRCPKCKFYVDRRDGMQCTYSCVDTPKTSLDGSPGKSGPIIQDIGARYGYSSYGVSIKNTTIFKDLRGLPSIHHLMMDIRIYCLN
nr:hypothetical protein [Tanacetum cinerariifolium]